MLKTGECLIVCSVTSVRSTRSEYFIGNKLHKGPSSISTYAGLKRNYRGEDGASHV